jgi:hypothetical protein
MTLSDDDEISENLQQEFNQINAKIDTVVSDLAKITAFFME